MKKLLIASGAVVLCAAVISLLHSATAVTACINSDCQFTTNIAWDTAGEPDTRPGTWGTTDVVQSQIPFVNVPQGYSVQVLHVTGDEIAAPHGEMAQSSMAYVLVGLTNSTPFQSPYVAPGLGSSGTFLYKQAPVSFTGSRIPFAEDVEGVLNSDNILIVKQALFLSTAGVPIHMEATVQVRFRYVPTTT